MLLTILLIVGAVGFSQEIKLSFQLHNAEESFPLILENTFLSIENVNPWLENLKDSLNKMGYLEAGVDSISKKENNWLIHLYIGKRIEKAKLFFDNETKVVLGNMGIRENKLSETEFSNENIRFLFKKIVTYWENKGHPFADVKLQLLDIDSHILSANVIVNKGSMIYFDTFDISGNAKISAKFLSALTEIKPGKPYNESLVRNLDRLLRTLPYVKIIRPSGIIFTGDKAKPMLYLEHRNNDFLDIIFGIAPPAGGGLTPNQKILITGEGRVRLGNMFRGGESVDLNIRSFNERSQEFKAKFEVPYIRGTNIGVDFGGSGVKFDTLFSQFQGRIGITYSFNGTNRLKFFVENQGTTLITVDTNLIKATRRLPNNQSMTIRNYGVESIINNLDYIFNPMKGFRVNTGISIGTKTIRRDSRIASINLESAGTKYNIYDSTQMKMLQYRYQFNLEKFTKIGQTSTIKTAFQGEGLFAPKIYFNELIRFGGVYSLRGFNEQSLFASNYTMLTIEYRYLLSQNSNLFAFWNGAYYEDKSVVRDISISDFPFGFGAGANLETGTGFLLTLAYALGREFDNPIRFQAGKFHFGLTGLF